jgi:uncharacterized membrane protein
MKKLRTITDRQMGQFIGILLRVGVITAACVAFAGGIWHLWARGAEIPRYASFAGEPAHLRNIGDIVQAAFSLKSDAVIQLGIVILISVPILRVAVSIIAFAFERDWLYCGVTALVLAILLFSLIGGPI